MTYPHLVPSPPSGRCAHRVVRFDEPGICYRPVAHVVDGVGLCREHWEQFLFWQRGGRVGTPAELFAHLTGMVGDDVTTAAAPAGMAFFTTRGGHVGYARLSRSVGRDGLWHWRLENPTRGRRRISRRRVDADAQLRLDVDGDLADDD